MSVLAELFGGVETRAAKLSGGSPKNPAYWVLKMFGLDRFGTDSGIKLDEDSALKYSPVWSAVNIISGAVGFLPFITYTEKGKNRKKAKNHRVFNLLHDRPNRYMDSLTFRETLTAHTLLWGNGYAEIERDRAFNPIALWPLLPNQTKPKILPDKKTLIFEVQKENGPAVPLPYYNVIHIKGLGFDGLKGYSVIEYAANSLGLGMAAEKFGAKFFASDSSPPGVLEVPQVLDDESYERMRKSWKETGGGLEDPHRLRILEQGTKWHQMGIAPEQAQFLETRKFEVATVARWFNIPLHMLNEMEQATFSNIEHQGMEFVYWTLIKWLKRWEFECNYKLFSPQEKRRLYCKFLVDALLRGDTASRYAAYKIGREGGWLCIDEIREKEDMNPLPDGKGKTFIEPMNMRVVGEKSTDADQKNMKEGTRSLFYDAWRRVVTKEVKSLRKAAEKPNNFVNFVKEFYEKHKLHLRSVFLPLYEAFCNGQSEDLVETLVKEYVDCQKRQLLDICQKQVEQKAINLLLDEWEVKIPVYRTESMFG